MRSAAKVVVLPDENIAQELLLVIPRLPQSPNALRGRHWTVKYKDSQDWVGQILLAIPIENRLQKRVGPSKRHVEIKLFSPYLPMDPDNLHGSVKPILDALKTNRLIFDDSKKWLNYKVQQKRATNTKALRTEICISSSGRGW